MTQVTAEGVAESLFESMPDLDDEERRLALTIYRLLAEGRPVRPERTNTSLASSQRKVNFSE